MSSPPDVNYTANFLYFDNSKAKNELGMEFTPVEQSLKESVDWFRAHGYI